jgi:hypothetical protein
MSSGWLTPWSIWIEKLQKFIIRNEDGNGPSWEFPNRNGYLPVTFNDDIYYRFVEHFNKILAAARTYVRSNEDLSAALPIVFTITNQPDVPRTITWAFDSHAQITAYTLAIAGTNAQGKTVTETFTQADGWSGETSNAFARITSITMSARTGTGAADTMDIGIGSKLGLSNNIIIASDVFKVDKSAAAANTADYTGAGNVTAEGTYDTVDVSTGAAIVDGDSFTIHYFNRLYTQN